jgi:hypothetical protein
MLGHCHSVFVHPLAVQLRRLRDLEFSVLELMAAGTEMRGLVDPIYAQRLEPPPGHRDWTIGGALSETWDILSGTEGPRMLRSFAANPRPGAMYRALRQESTRVHSKRAWQALLAGYDLYHMHYLDLALVPALAAIPDDKPVVLSIWGSDLMGAAGVDTYSRHMEVCERAQVITLRSLGMREIFLSKFGRRFLPKIRIAKFGVALCDVIDRLDQKESRAAFCARHGIDPGKLIVCVGHSGARADRHLQIVEALAGVQGVRERMSLVLPLTYGAAPGYLDAVRAALQQSGLQATLLTDYMSHEEVAALRQASDILIALPEQDALSGAMCETLYAGNAVITGAWLPYTEFWDAGVWIERIADIASLKDALPRVVAERASLEPRLAQNREKIRPLVDYNHSIGGWVEAYDAAISGRGR